MLAFIKGKVAEYNENYLVVEASGVGYEMTATANAVFKFSPETGEVLVPTYMVVREDSVTLFGFADNNFVDVCSLVKGSNKIVVLQPCFATTPLQFFPLRGKRCR